MVGCEDWKSERVKWRRGGEGSRGSGDSLLGGRDGRERRLV
jgi:hypothetical protein